LMVRDVDAANWVRGFGRVVRDPDSEEAQTKNNQRESREDPIALAIRLIIESRVGRSLIVFEKKAEGRLRFRKRPSFRWR
jgi:hypothetical protein